MPENNKSIDEMFKFTAGTYNLDGDLQKLFDLPVKDAYTPERLISEMQLLREAINRLVVVMEKVIVANYQKRDWDELTETLKTAKLQPIQK